MTTAILIFAIGYACGRVRPLRWFFREVPPPDDPHIRTVTGPDGKPVRLFVP